MSDCGDTTVASPVPVCGLWWWMLQRWVDLTGLTRLCSWPVYAAQCK